MTAATTAHDDQIRAAAREAQTVMGRLRRTGHARGDLDPRQVPAVARVLDELAGRLAFGGLTPCRHLARHAPQVVHWLAWDQGQVVCAGCAVSRVAGIRGTTQDDTCDGCGATGVPVVATITADGLVLVHAGFCASCSPALHTRTAS